MSSEPAVARVVEKGSFSAAARSLDLTPSAVSKLIGRLEGRLGTRLLARTTRALTLTEEGLAYHRAAERILGELNAADQAVATGSARGRIRVNASLPLGTPVDVTGAGAEQARVLTQRAEVAQRPQAPTRNLRRVVAAIDPIEHAVRSAAVLHPRPESKTNEMTLLLKQLVGEYDRIPLRRVSKLGDEERGAQCFRLAFGERVGLVVSTPRIVGRVRPFPGEGVEREDVRVRMQ